jgi:glycerophosphoryl diester phosphodiesterase
MTTLYPTFDTQGHRGCRGLRPENTLPAFQHALALGCDTLELDLVISADNQVLVSHEPWLSPDYCLAPDGQPVTAEKIYNLYQMTYAQIRACDCGSRLHPRFPLQQLQTTFKPLLSEVFALGEAHHKPPFYNIEIKRVAAHDGIFHPKMETFADLVLAEVQKSNIKDRIIIQCFDLPTLRYLRARAPHLPLSLLVETSQGIQADIQKLGFLPEFYSPYFPLLNSAQITWAKANNVRVLPWTVNEIQDMQQLIALGVDGIISDYPDRLLALVKKN